MSNLDDTIKKSLNEIKNNCICKRLTRELNDLSLSSDDNMLHIQSIEFDEKGFPIVALVDYSTDNINIYYFHLGEFYPFRNPKIKINNSDYLEFLRIRTFVFQQLLKKINGINCLCCESYLCNERWTPATRLINIVNEIRLFRKYKRDIINKFYANKIKRMYLFDDIDLDSWLF